MCLENMGSCGLTPVAEDCMSHVRKDVSQSTQTGAQSAHVLASNCDARDIVISLGPAHQLFELRIKGRTTGGQLLRV